MLAVGYKSEWVLSSYTLLHIIYRNVTRCATVNTEQRLPNSLQQFSSLLFSRDWITELLNGMQAATVRAMLHQAI